MSACEDFINKAIQALPEYCCSQDLVKIGMYRSEQSAYYARKIKDSPEYFKIGSAIMYPKPSVIDYLKKSAHTC